MKKRTGIMTGSMKKLLCILMSSAMIVTAVPGQIFAAETIEETAAEVLTGDTMQETVIETDEASQEIVTDTVSEDAEGEETPAAAPAQIEINQGLGLHAKLTGGDETYINDFVAKKQTVVIVKIPDSDAYTEEQAKSAVSDYKLEAKAVVNGQESDNCELSATGDKFSVKKLFDKNCDPESGWYAVADFPTGPDKGTYNFHIKKGDTEIAVNNGVNFYETRPLNILVVPVNAYWSKVTEAGKKDAPGASSCKDGQFSDPNGNQMGWSSLCSELKKYMLDVYPIAEINLEEGSEINASTEDFDMCNDDGMRKLWEEACKLQTKGKDGRDRYDLILAFVQYRQGADGSGQGYTYGKPSNIITYSDADMLPTVAHEIAHCYQVGDEYNGGSFNKAINFPPKGYSGSDFVSGANITVNDTNSAYWMSPAQYKSSAGAGSKKNKVDVDGAGTMVNLSLHPYSLSQEKFITWGGVDANGNAKGDNVGPTISWMGSGYSGCDGYYWTNSVIWDHLFKQFVTKEKKAAQPAEEEAEAEGTESSNAEIYIDSLLADGDDDNPIFEEDDFYYDEDCRWGDSRMVEVEGWIVKDKGNVRFDMNPMYSYDGDLEYIEVLDDLYKNSKDVYTFVALDSQGRIIASPVDGEWAAAEFNGSFFNPFTASLQKEVHFRFDAEYPEGTADFAIIKGNLEGKVAEDGTYKGAFAWRASTDENFYADFETVPEGGLLYADVNSNTAEVEWEVYCDGKLYEGPTEDMALYTEVYYCPEGDDGEAIYVGCSEDEDWTEGSIWFDTDSQFDTKWTRNAYVWIKVTTGVNAFDIYSDENEITLCNSQITLSGAGISGNMENGYTAEYTGAAITPNVDVKAYDPGTGKYIALKKDKDYTVSYESNTAIGSADVVVQGIGLYAGKNIQEFEIIRKALAGTPENIPDMVYTADLDSKIQKYLIVKDANNKQLVYGTDFTVKYTSDEKTASTLAKLIPAAPEEAVGVTVSYYGKGNYEGINAKCVWFDVLPASEEAIELTAENTVIELKSDSVQYTGKALKPAIKSVKVDGKAIKSSCYKLVYTDNTEIGTGRVTVVGKNGYTGSQFKNFTIAPKSVKSVSVSGIKNQSYTGGAISVDSLPITVKAGGITLRKGIDYTVEAVEGCDYTNVTATVSKDKAPKVVIKLISTEDAQKAMKKNSEYPRVELSAKAKKEITKSFKIVPTGLKTGAVTSSVKNNEEKKNIVKSADGTTAIATLKAAPKADLKKYSFVITGKEDKLEKNANIAEAVSLKAFGREINPEYYSVTVTATQDGKVGTITFKAKSKTGVTGSRKVKFLYAKEGQE